MSKEKQRLDELTICLRVAKEFKDGMVVNLGHGLPALAGEFIPENKTVFLHAEIGVLGYGPLAAPGEEDIDLLNASTQYITPKPGMCVFDSATSFDIIRGGHLDLAVLGAFQVSERGPLSEK